MDIYSYLPQTETTLLFKEFNDAIPGMLQEFNHALPEFVQEVNHAIPERLRDWRLFWLYILANILLLWGLGRFMKMSKGRSWQGKVRMMKKGFERNVRKLQPGVLEGVH